MAKMSRAERKRLGLQRPVASDTESNVPENAGDIIDSAIASVQSAGATAIEPKSRLVRTTRRVVARDVAASLDYSAETAMVAADLRRIGFWGALFVIIMLAIKLSGLL
ncbi:MAG: hypothetical protein ACK5GU_06635 [Chloroflexota bacterium]|jgi:hypothetical protein